MGKNTVLDSIKNYKEVFGDVASQIKKVNGSQELTDQGKATRIADIESKNASRLTASKNNLLTAIEELKGDMIATRRNQVAEGLADLDKIAFVVNGIQNNAYDETMVSDLLSGFGGNPVALANIRTALASSKNHDYNTMAMDIPAPADINRVVGNLDRMTKTLNEERNISAIMGDNDMTAQLYANGTSFDSWMGYISDNVAD